MDFDKHSFYNKIKHNKIHKLTTSFINIQKIINTSDSKGIFLTDKPAKKFRKKKKEKKLFTQRDHLVGANSLCGLRRRGCRAWPWDLPAAYARTRPSPAI